MPDPHRQASDAALELLDSEIDTATSSRFSLRPMIAPSGSAVTADFKCIAEDDDGVLHEDPVGMLVGGLDLGDVPPTAAKRVHVAVPLGERKVSVDRHAVEVRLDFWTMRARRNAVSRTSRDNGDPLCQIGGRRIGLPRQP